MQIRLKKWTLFNLHSFTFSSFTSPGAQSPGNPRLQQQAARCRCNSRRPLLICIPTLGMQNGDTNLPAKYQETAKQRHPQGTQKAAGNFNTLPSMHPKREASSFSSGAKGVSRRLRSPSCSASPPAGFGIQVPMWPGQGARESLKSSPACPVLAGKNWSSGRDGTGAGVMGVCTSLSPSPRLSAGD